jgi:hypothetical protein
MSAREVYYEDLIDLPQPRRKDSRDLWNKLVEATMPVVLPKGEIEEGIRLIEELESHVRAVKTLVLVAPEQAAAIDDARLAETFRALTEAWQSETVTESSLSNVAMSPSYQRIIGLGPRVLPLVFRDLQECGGPWFWALRALTGENPVPADHRGNVALMTEDWLKWGRNRGHL